MLSNRIVFTFLLTLFQFKLLLASHIIGGDMSVQNVIGDRYEVKLNLYYDALDGEDVVEDSVLITKIASYFKEIFSVSPTPISTSELE